MLIVDEKIRLVKNVICEINCLKEGNIKCADQMLQFREEAYNRIWAMECLIAEDDSTLQPIIEYMYEQIKELTLKLIIKN